LQAEGNDLHAAPLKRNYSWEEAQSNSRNPESIVVKSEPADRPQVSISPRYDDSLEPETDDLDEEGRESERLLNNMHPILTGPIFQVKKNE